MGSFGLGRVFGIPLRLDPSWVPMAALITWTLSQNYFPAFLPRQSDLADVALALVAMILLFACLVAHEIGHALTARAFGISTARITLFLFGGVAMMRSEPHTPKAEFWIAIAGPAVSLAIALIAAALSLVWPLLGGGRTGLVLLDFLFAVNIVFAVFNMIPAFPMDGGRIFRALLWRQSRSLILATRRATFLSQILAGLAILYGGWLIYEDGIRLNTVWPILIGGFIFMNARRIYKAAGGG